MWIPVDDPMLVSKSGILYEPLAEEVAALVEAEDYDNAIQVYEKAVNTAHSQEEDAWIDLGNLYVRKKDYEKAKQAYLSSLAINHESLRANHNLANLFYQLEDIDNTLVYLTKVLTLKHSFRLSLILMNELLHGESSERLEAAFKKVIAVDSKNYMAAINLARAYMIHKLPDKAAKTLVWTWNNVPESYMEDFLCDLGRAFFKNEQYDYARGFFEMLVSRNSDVSIYHYWLASAYGMEHKYPQAVESLETMMLLDRNNAYENLFSEDEMRGNKEKDLEMLVYSCVSANDAKHNAKALNYVKEGLDEFPDNQFMTFHYGRLLCDSREYEKAKSYIDKALSYKSDDVYYQTIHSIITYRLEGFEAARPVFDSVIKNAEQPHLYIPYLFNISEMLHCDGYPELANDLKSRAEEIMAARKIKH